MTTMKNMVDRARKNAVKLGFHLKKASPTIMVAVAVGSGVAAAVMACKATLKAQDVLKEHAETVTLIHDVDEGKVETTEEYTQEDKNKDLTMVYVKTGVSLTKLYAPAVALGCVSIACMVGSHKIMLKRNAVLTAAYVALDKNFTSYKERVTEKFGDVVQKELETGAKQVALKKEEEDAVEKHTTVTDGAYGTYSMIFDESVDRWEKDAKMNRNYLYMVETAANKKLRMNGHLFLNDVMGMIGGSQYHTPQGQLVGWIYDPDDPKLQNHVDFGITNYVTGSMELQSFLDGDEPSVVLNFNCDGVILDKI